MTTLCGEAGFGKAQTTGSRSAFLWASGGVRSARTLRLFGYEKPRIADSLSDITGDAVRPELRFVKLKLEVRNNTNSPIDVFSRQFLGTKLRFVRTISLSRRRSRVGRVAPIVMEPAAR